MGGDRRRSPEGDRKALWNYANDQFEETDNYDHRPKSTHECGVSGAFSPNTPPFYVSFSTVIFPSVTFSRTRSPSAILPPSSSSLSVSSTVR